MTRRALIFASTPVFGLRPARSVFVRTSNEPKDDSLTLSARDRASEISFSTSSTKREDSTRDSPTVL